jgi:general secretion pathway protein M
MKWWLTAKKSTKRLIFFAAHIAALGALVTVVALPINAFFADRDDSIAEQLLVLGRMETIAAQDLAVQSAQHELEAQLRKGELLASANEGAINADLQKRLKGFTEAAGARLRSVQGLPPRTVERIRYSGSRIELQGVIQSLQRATHAIESDKPYLFVTAAVIRPALAVATGPGASQEPVLQAQLDVYAATGIEGPSP